MAKIDTTAIESVYIGEANKCCCGCAGNHTTAPRSVAYVARKLIEHAANVDIGGGCVSVDVGERRYIAYMKAST